MEKNIEQFIYEEIIKGEGKVTFDYLGKKSIMKAMESYAKYKVNQLNKSDVDSGKRLHLPPIKKVEVVGCRHPINNREYYKDGVYKCWCCGHVVA